MKGTTNDKLYQNLHDDAIEAPVRNAKRKKIVHPEDMPWEMSKHGILKHLLNEQMNTRMETVDAYMQIIPPGSRSGKHRQLAESCIYVVEGRGYDLHQDCDVEITDTYHWKAQDEVKRFEWEAGDVIYIPPNTICQHFNADPERPVRLIVAVNRIYKQCGLNDLEQIENAPEYEPGITLTPERVAKYLAAHAAAEEETGPATGPEAYTNPAKTTVGVHQYIAGSLHVPLTQFERRLSELPADRPLLVYCAGGYRSSIAASLLQRAGFPAVSDLAGGMAAWEAASLPLGGKHDSDVVRN
jgi:rhodanese-related sulfurtransferase/quercetin dioxygenase-like cupin family protein